MIYKTHRMFALTLTAATLLMAQAPVDAWQTYATMGAAYVAAPIPDLDKNGSWISRQVPFVDRFFSMFGHRTLTHSLLFTTGVAVLFGLLHAPVWLTVGFVIGWISHPIIDLFNPQGVHLLWPLPKKLWIRFPGFMTTTTGSEMEPAIHWVLELLFVLLLAVMAARYIVWNQGQVLAFVHLEGVARYWVDRLTSWTVQPGLRDALRTWGVGQW